MKEMEMPTVCGCGNVFDLHDGCGNHNNTITICDDCAEHNHKRKEYLSQIESWQNLIDDHQEEIDSIKEMIEDYKTNLEQMPEFK